MMRRSEVLSLAGAAVFSSVLPARAQQSPAIRLGIVAVEEGAALYYAQERGFFRQAGVNVELTKFPNGAAVAQGVSPAHSISGSRTADRWPWGTSAAYRLLWWRASLFSRKLRRCATSSLENDPGSVPLRISPAEPSRPPA